MYATKIYRLSSSGHNPKEWEEIPEVKAERPIGGYAEISLQKLNVRGTTILVQWMGAKNGVWYPHGGVFMLSKRPLY